jgi:hypothetical protein
MPAEIVPATVAVLTYARSKLLHLLHQLIAAHPLEIVIHVDLPRIAEAES